MAGGKTQHVQLGVKRAIDFVGALFILTLLSPLLLLLALAIKYESAGSPFEVTPEDCYSHRKIPVLRFQRGTRTDYVLSETGLLELPMLINVLRGEMSLVGLRREIRIPPFLPGSLVEPLYSNPLKPGVISLELPPELANPALAPIQADLYYVANWSVWLDLKILFHRLIGL
jgi:polysaccharide biosynthesis protein PslA